ncbi:MAG: hypothetical protein ABIA02_03040 [Candidatus Falkowbacteria bacterium]
MKEKIELNKNQEQSKDVKFEELKAKRLEMLLKDPITTNNNFFGFAKKIESEHPDHDEYMYYHFLKGSGIVGKEEKDWKKIDLPGDLIEKFIEESYEEFKEREEKGLYAKKEN